MKLLETCCSEDKHELSFPSFSAVFIHTFMMDGDSSFDLLRDTVLCDYESMMQQMIRDLKDKPKEGQRPVSSLAEKADRCIVNMNPDVENLLFSAYSLQNKQIARYSMKGFDFRIPVRAALEKDKTGKYVPDFFPLDFEGHANVEVSQFFGNIFSVTYRFLFDGFTCRILEADENDNEGLGSKGRRTVEAHTNHIISLLATCLGAEYWSEDDFDDDHKGSIDLMNRLIVKDFWIDEDGKEITSETQRKDGNPWVLKEEDRVFDMVALRYKKFLMRKYMVDPMTEEKLDHVGVADDSRYAMVDIWETVKHPYGDKDLFGEKHDPQLSEAEIIDHIRDHHKPELVGLMTMYPAEWPYRAAEAYDEVCGENIAIDTDDLVLAGSHMTVVIGTYGRRGDGVGGVNWKKMMMERRFYHVSWEEYLLIVQFVLAKKYTLDNAVDKLLKLTENMADITKEVIGKCAREALAASKKVIELDVIKHMKFPSHKVMFDRTMRRLRVDEDFERFKDVQEVVSGNLQSLGDYQAAKQDSFMNNLLIAISVVSLFELAFQSSSWPFLESISEKGVFHMGIAPWTSMISVGLAVIALAVVGWKSKLRKRFTNWLKKKIHG